MNGPRASTGISMSVARESTFVSRHTKPCALSDTRRGCVGQTMLRGRLHYVPYHDSSCRRAFTEGEFEDAMLGFMARGAHSEDYSTSVSTYRRIFGDYCTVNAPFAVTTSCVTVLSCNFDGDHIYMSGRTTYSPSDICSSSSSRRRSSSSYSSSSYSPSSSTHGSSSSTHVSLVGMKWLFYIFVLLPCYIIGKCCCKKDDPPAQTPVSRVSIFVLLWNYQRTQPVH